MGITGGREFPQLPCRETAERDDWAVLDFSLRTRRPVLMLTLGRPTDVPGRVPLGPGREG